MKEGYLQSKIVEMEAQLNAMHEEIRQWEKRFAGAEVKRAAFDQTMKEAEGTIHKINEFTATAKTALEKMCSIESNLADFREQLNSDMEKKLDKEFLDMVEDVKEDVNKHSMQFMEELAERMGVMMKDLLTKATIDPVKYNDEAMKISEKLYNGMSHESRKELDISTRKYIREIKKNQKDE